jgi:hypothetical protein
MKKLLFLQEKEKKELLNYIIKQLETKNRLLMLIMINTDKKPPLPLAARNDFVTRIKL